jgi:hypothetical protein
MKHQNYNTNMKKSAIDIYNELPNELKDSELSISKENPIKGFESLLNHYGMVSKYEVEDEIETKDEVEDSKSNLEIRTLEFKNSLIPFKQKYSIDMLKDFFGYWTEPNKSNTKLKFELQQTWSISRRLETWAKNDKTFAPKQQIKQDRL